MMTHKDLRIFIRGCIIIIAFQIFREVSIL